MSPGGVWPWPPCAPRPPPRSRPNCQWLLLAYRACVRRKTLYACAGRPSPCARRASRAARSERPSASETASWTKRSTACRRRPGRGAHELRTTAGPAARDLRAEGLSLKQIAAKLGVSKSTVSLWVRDPALPPLSPQEHRRLKAQQARLPRLHPRVRGRRGSGAILARCHRGGSGPVPQADTETAQPRRPSGKTSAATTTAVFASMCYGTPSSTGTSRAGPEP